MRKTLSIVAAALLVATLPACSSSNTKDEARECITVPESIMERIAEGANAAPIMPVSAGAVRSETRADATIVAMSFTDVNGDESTGAWAILGTLEEPGATLALDGYASNFTEWPNEMNGEKFSVAEDGVSEAKDCLTSS